MTIRRYYDDSYARAFTARVTESFVLGDAAAVVLDETWFYPTSGGQPHDTGTLGGAKVQDVSIREGDGAVVHLLDATVPEGPAAGAIDWSRRLDHMQQHTGQHILSQAFLRECNAPTIGFHLGTEHVSIDLEAANLTDADLARAEATANEVVAGNLSVRAWFPTDEEISELALRKTPQVQGPLRVVAIGDFDRSACGGTHVAATGEIGLISVLRRERLKRGVRVEFLCGGRARRDYSTKHALLKELSAAFTCSPPELPAACARLSDALLETRRQLAVLAERDLDREASERLHSALRVQELRVISAAWEGRPVEEVKSLALRMTAMPGVVALLGVAGVRTQLVFIRSDDVAYDLKPLFDRTLATLGGGRGGGGGRILQGAADPATRGRVEEVLATAAALVRPAGDA